MNDLTDSITVPRRPRRQQRPRGLSPAGIVEHFLREATNDGECLIAPDSMLSSGYPIVGIAGRSYRLHRLSLERSLGRSLLPDERACHRCNKPACINPDHLYAGTDKENWADRRAAGREAPPRGERNGNRVLTESAVVAIRERCAAGTSQYVVASEYGVRQATISKIVRRERWAHV